MDERATHRPTGIVDAHPAASVGVRDRSERSPINDGGPHDAADMNDVFRAIAARIDVVLDEKARTPSDARRHAVSTEVLRFSADGRLDVDDRKHEVSNEASTSSPTTVASAPVAPPSPPAAALDRSGVDDRLRAARDRLAERRSRAAAERVDPPGTRSPRVRILAWRRTELRALAQRMLIGLAIVGASAVVSILVT